MWFYSHIPFKGLDLTYPLWKALTTFFVGLGSTTSSSTIHNEAELGDDDVFTVSSLSFAFQVSGK